MAISYLILGSNSANKKTNLDCAVILISQTIGTVHNSSNVYITEAWGYDSPNTYLNQVIAIETLLSPEKLLTETQNIEKKLGRTSKSVNGVYQDRPIDVDILFYDNLIIQSPELEIPHPRIQERRFVLEPLCEIAPKLMHPKLQTTVIDLLGKCPDELMVKKLKPF